MGLFGRKKKEETPFVTVVIAAAGASRRMGGENKQLILLDGIPVLGRTLLAFQQSPYIREIILAAAEEHMAEYAALGRQLKIDSPVPAPPAKPRRTANIWPFTTGRGRWCVSRSLKLSAKPLSFTAPQVRASP